MIEYLDLHNVIEHFLRDMEVMQLCKRFKNTKIRNNKRIGIIRYDNVYPP